MTTPSNQQKRFVFYRKNYLFSISRPGVLVFDESRLICCDNNLQEVFNIPLQTLSVKEGFGIFSVFESGKRLSILTPVGGNTAPSPSKQLKDFLQSDVSGVNNGTLVAGAAGTSSIGSAISAGAPVLGAAAVGIGAVGEVVAATQYVGQQKSLRAFLQSIGVLTK